MESSRATEEINNGHVFLPGKEEALYGRFRLRYSSSFNEYYSGTSESYSNKPKILGNSLESMIYSCENIQRTIDSISEEVYIERKVKEHNARVVWRFKFVPCGLVLDRLTMKMTYLESGGGQVTVSVSGDSGSPSVLYYSSDVYMTITRLEGSSTLTIKVNMIGENENHATRILSEGLHGPHFDYPFDIQIRLKRPDFTIGRSVIFIGLMHSRRELPNGKNRQKKKGSKSSDNTSKQLNAGHLNILIHKAKRLPCRENGTYAEPKVKCTLHGNGTSLKVKSHPAPKNLNPTWNERLVIPNVTLDQLSYSQLELQVVHNKSMLKLKSTETLGYTVLQSQNVIGTWKSPTCRNNSINRPHEIRLPSQAKSSIKNPKKISTTTLTSSATFHGVSDLPRYRRRCSDDYEDASFCIMANDNKSFEDDMKLPFSTSFDKGNNTVSNNNINNSNNNNNNNNNNNKHSNNTSFLQTCNIKKAKEDKCEEESNDTNETAENTTERTLTQRSSSDEPKEEASEIPNINNKIAGENEEGKEIKVSSPESARTNSEMDSDMENITFRDHYYQKLFSRVSKSSDLTMDDESFEVLPSFREDKEDLQYLKQENAKLQTQFIDISNTLDESEIDHLHNRREIDMPYDDRSESKQLDESLDNLLNSLRESSVDPQLQDNQDGGKHNEIPSETLDTLSSINEDNGDEIENKNDGDNNNGDNGDKNESDEEVLVYRPKSSLKRSVSYSEQIRNAFKSKLVNKNKPTTLAKELDTLEDPDDTEDIKNQTTDDSSITHNLSINKNNSSSNSDDISKDIRDHNMTTTNSNTSEINVLQLDLHQQQSQSNDNLNSVEDISSTIDHDDDSQSAKRRTVSVDNSQLTPSRTRRYEVNSDNHSTATGANNNVFNNKTETNKLSSVGTSNKRVTIKRSHSFSDLIDINKKRDKKFNKKRNFSNKLYRSGSVSNILDDFFEEKAKMLSHEHWKMVTSTPEQWFYCWHPLLGVNNLLSNW